MSTTPPRTAKDTPITHPRVLRVITIMVGQGIVEDWEIAKKLKERKLGSYTAEQVRNARADFGVANPRPIQPSKIDAVPSNPLPPGDVPDDMLDRARLLRDLAWSRAAAALHSDTDKGNAISALQNQAREWDRWILELEEQRLGIKTPSEGESKVLIAFSIVWRALTLEQHMKVEAELRHRLGPQWDEGIDVPEMEQERVNSDKPESSNEEAVSE